MSIEYFAIATLDDSAIEAVITHLRSAGIYDVSPSEDPRRVVLRLKGQPRRPDWPEDAEIHFQPTRIYVVVHSASRADRTALIKGLEESLAANGHVAAHFEEG